MTTMIAQKSKSTSLLTLSAFLIFGFAGPSLSQASVLVYEGFGGATANAGLGGYSGTDGVTEIGLTGTWSANNGAAVTQFKVRNTDLFNFAIDGGYGYPLDGSGNQHWLEHQNEWNATIGTRPLASAIDLTMDGTYYMSFFSRAGGNDVILQIGLSNGTDELMWGNGYNRGLTAYYGPLGTPADTNNNETNVAAGGWDDSFWVAKLEKTNSDSDHDLTVSIMYYHLDANNTIDLGDPAEWTRTLALTGVNASFDTFHLKIDGAGQFPGMDELRLGETWTDVTGVIPEPSTYALLAGVLALGIVAIRRRRS